MLVVTGGWPSVSLATAIGEGDSSQALCWGLRFGISHSCLLQGSEACYLNRLLAGSWRYELDILRHPDSNLCLGHRAAIKEVGTAQYIVRIAGNVLSPAWIPLLTFFTGAILLLHRNILWNHGSSYAHSYSSCYNVTGFMMRIYRNTLAHHRGRFCGSRLGDHCSPISDTTIMSSMFSGADHVDHVNSQMPYAFVAAAGAVAGMFLLVSAFQCFSPLFLVLLLHASSFTLFLNQ